MHVEKVKETIDFYSFTDIKLCIVDTIGADYELNKNSIILRFKDLNREHLLSILRDYAKDCILIFDNIYQWYDKDNIKEFHEELQKIIKENNIGILI